MAQNPGSNMAYTKADVPFSNRGYFLGWGPKAKTVGAAVPRVVLSAETGTRTTQNLFGKEKLALCLLMKF
jgi:hypothetical protein